MSVSQLLFGASKIIKIAYKKCFSKMKQIALVPLILAYPV